MRCPADIVGRGARMAANWAVAFPTITLLLILLEPMMKGWPLIARTLVLVTLMVPIVGVVASMITPWIQAQIKSLQSKSE